MIKRISLSLLALFIIIGTTACKKDLFILYAQSLPITKNLAWDASLVDATHGAPDSYVVRLDGTVINTVTSLTSPFTINAIGPHVLTVTAVNQWGSAVGTLNFVVAIPANPSNMRIQ